MDKKIIKRLIINFSIFTFFSLIGAALLTYGFLVDASFSTQGTTFQENDLTLMSFLQSNDLSLFQIDTAREIIDTAFAGTDITTNLLELQYIALGGAFSLMLSAALLVLIPLDVLVFTYRLKRNQDVALPQRTVVYGHRSTVLPEDEEKAKMNEEIKLLKNQIAEKQRELKKKNKK